MALNRSDYKIFYVSHTRNDDNFQTLMTNDCLKNQYLRLIRNKTFSL